MTKALLKPGDLAAPMHPRDGLSPQHRDVFDALMLAGHIDDAEQLVKDLSVYEEGSIEVDYLISKRLFVRNLWVNLIARQIEYSTCNKGPMPCDGCLHEARKIAPSVWRVAENYMNESQLGLTNLDRFQMLEAMENMIRKEAAIVSHKGTSLPVLPTAEEEGLTLQKAPDLENLDG